MVIIFQWGFLAAKGVVDILTIVMVTREGILKVVEVPMILVNPEILDT